MPRHGVHHSATRHAPDRPVHMVASGSKAGSSVTTTRNSANSPASTTWLRGRRPHHVHTIPRRLQPLEADGEVVVVAAVFGQRDAERRLCEGDFADAGGVAGSGDAPGGHHGELVVVGPGGASAKPASAEEPHHLGRHSSHPPFLGGVPDGCRDDNHHRHHHPTPRSPRSSQPHPPHAPPSQLIGRFTGPLSAPTRCSACPTARRSTR